MMRKIYLLLATSVLVVLGASADQSFSVKTDEVGWVPLEMVGMPPGLQLRALHENSGTKMNSAMVKYPKGFREPRHHHDTCGHYIYVIKGRLNSPDGDLLPGTFSYAAPKEPHGPYTAVEGTEILFYTDGPLDFVVDE